MPQVRVAKIVTFISVHKQSTVDSAEFERLETARDVQVVQKFELHNVGKVTAGDNL